MEDKVLRGAKNLINKNRPLIYLEMWNTDHFVKSHSVLAELGYVCVNPTLYYQIFMYAPKEKYMLDSPTLGLQVGELFLLQNHVVYAIPNTITQYIRFHFRKFRITTFVLFGLTWILLVCLHLLG